MANWIDQKHPEYDQRTKRAAYSWDHYTGQVLEKVMEKVGILRSDFAASMVERVGPESQPQTIYSAVINNTDHDYFPRRAQGETDAQYGERARLSIYPPHMAKVVDSFVGSIASVEPKSVRKWGPESGEGDSKSIGGLGDPLDEDSIAFRLWRSIDGAGTNWMTRVKQVATRLSVYHRVWYIVEGTGMDGQDAQVKLFDPADVMDWVEADGRLVEVKVKSSVDLRSSVMDESKVEVRYIVYTVDGWSKWRQDAKTKEAELLEQGAWSQPFYTDKTRREKRLPIGCVCLPLSREVGHQLAHSANGLYNLLADARNMLRVANHPKLAGNVEDSVYDDVLAALSRGGNVLQGEWSYIAPDANNAKLALEAYSQQVTDFYLTAFQEYNDAAKQATATEIKADESRGRFAYLNLLAGALDEFENDVLFLLTQVYFPSKPDLWGSATVERTTDYTPEDAQEMAAALVGVVSKLTFDLPPAVQMEITARVLEAFGIPFDREELKAKAKEAEIEREQMMAEEREFNMARAA